MDEWLLEVVLILLVGYLLYEKYRQTKLKEYLLSAFLIALSFAGYLLLGNKLPIYACFVILSLLLFRVWKKSP